jgi:GTP-binding protein
MAPLFDLIVAPCAAAQGARGARSHAGTTLEADPYLGRMLTGRIESGAIKPMPVKVLDRDGKRDRAGRI